MDAVCFRSLLMTEAGAVLHHHRTWPWRMLQLPLGIAGFSGDRGRASVSMALACRVRAMPVSSTAAKSGSRCGCQRCLLPSAEDRKLVFSDWRTQAGEQGVERFGRARFAQSQSAASPLQSSWSARNLATKGTADNALKRQQAGSSNGCHDLRATLCMAHCGRSQRAQAQQKAGGCHPRQQRWRASFQPERSLSLSETSSSR